MVHKPKTSSTSTLEAMLNETLTLLQSTEKKVARMESKMNELSERQDCTMLLDQNLDLTLSGMALLLTSDRQVDNDT